MIQIDEFYLDLQRKGNDVSLRKESLFSARDEFRNPFPGLRPFKTSEFIFFFGRDQQVQDLTEKLYNTQFLAVVGSSGAGKSSLIRAGLVPKLFAGSFYKNGNKWRVAVCRPGQDPLDNLAVALAMTKCSDDNEENIKKEAESAKNELEDSIYGISEYKQRCDVENGESNNLLIVVDQFEELFRFSDEQNSATSDFNRRIKFVNLLLEASSGADESIYVIITMRSDFLGQCVRYKGLAEAINRGQYLVPQLNREQLQQAIENPLQVVQKKISNNLVFKMTNELERSRIYRSLDQLPVLQHALMRSYRKSVKTGKGEISDEIFDSIGGLERAIDEHANRILRAKSFGDSKIQITKILFQSLTDATRESGRNPMKLGKVLALIHSQIPGVDDQEIFEVISRFRAETVSFLMPPPNVDLARNPDVFIDISHESLMRNWALLKTWMAEEEAAGELYRRLNERRRLYSKGNTGEILKGATLDEITAWSKSPRNNILWAQRYHVKNENAEQLYHENLLFLQESNDQAEAIKRTIQADAIKRLRQNVRVRWLILIGALLLVGFLSVVFLYDRSRFLADNGFWIAFLSEKETNELATWQIFHNRDYVLKYKWLAEARAQISKDPDRSLRLALKAAEFGSEDAEKWIASVVRGSKKYERKYLVQDSVVGVEYDPKSDEAFNVIANNRFYHVSGTHGFIESSQGKRVDIKIKGNRNQFFGPDGNYLLVFNRNDQTVTRIGRRQPGEKTFNVSPWLPKDNSNVNMELSRDGKFLVITNTRNDGITDAVTSGYVVDLEPGPNLSPRLYFPIAEKMVVNFIYFFNESADFAVVGEKNVAVFNMKSKASNFISCPVQIKSVSNNDRSQFHVFNLGNLISVVSDDEIYHLKDLMKAKRLYPLKPNGDLQVPGPDGPDSVILSNDRIINAAISSDAHLAYTVNNGRMVGMEFNVFNLKSGKQEETIIWPSFAPQYIKASPRENNGRFLTTGSPNLQDPDPVKLWYTYEWDVNSHDSITFDFLKSNASYLRNLTFSEKILYEIEDCRSVTDPNSLLSCGEFYQSLFYAEQSPVFSHRRFIGINADRDNKDAHRLLERAFDSYKAYFNTRPKVLDISFADFLTTSIELDRLSERLKRKSDHCITTARVTADFLAGVKRNDSIGDMMKMRDVILSLNNRAKGWTEKEKAIFESQIYRAFSASFDEHLSYFASNDSFPSSLITVAFKGFIDVAMALDSIEASNPRLRSESERSKQLLNSAKRVSYQLSVTNPPNLQGFGNNLIYLTRRYKLDENEKRIIDSLLHQKPIRSTKRTMKRSPSPH